MMCANMHYSAQKVFIFRFASSHAKYPMLCEMYTEFLSLSEKETPIGSCLIDIVLLLKVVAHLIGPRCETLFCRHVERRRSLSNLSLKIKSRTTKNPLGKEMRAVLTFHLFALLDFSFIVHCVINNAVIWIKNMSYSFFKLLFIRNMFVSAFCCCWWEYCTF